MQILNLNKFVYYKQENKYINKFLFSYFFFFKMRVQNPNKNMDCFSSCLCQNLNDVSRSNIQNQSLKIQFKRQKISLKRRSDFNYLTERNSAPYGKKIWEERTRTGTERVQNQTGTFRKNIKSMRSTAVPVQQQYLRNNMILMNYSTRTFEIPPNKINNSNLTPLNMPSLSLNIPKFNLIKESLTERNSICNVKSHPQFATQMNQKKQLNSWIPELKPNFKSPKSSFYKDRNDFQNQYQTVNSVFSNSIIEERISESTIQIDFFNPSQTRLFGMGDDLNRLKGTRKQK